MSGVATSATTAPRWTWPALPSRSAASTRRSRNSSPRPPKSRSGHSDGQGGSARRSAGLEPNGSSRWTARSSASPAPCTPPWSSWEAQRGDCGRCHHGAVYRLVYRVLLRRLPAETAHAAGFWLIRVAGAMPGGNWLLRRWCTPRDPVLRVRALGLDLPGPLGLAAGFDKDARGADALGALGFAFVEVGTVTAQAQPGNPRPRMFRLPADRALINRMGFNNAGAAVAAERLQRRA